MALVPLLIAACVRARHAERLMNVVRLALFVHAIGLAAATRDFALCTQSRWTRKVLAAVDAVAGRGRAHFGGCEGEGST